MSINFFEEYPTEDTMNKLGLIDWAATVLVAAPSLQEFESIRAAYAPRHPHITFGWWPTIPGSYWVSAFANPSDLDSLFAEVASVKQEKELPILLDLELPFRKSLYLKNLFNMRKNKRKIAAFLERASKYNLKIYTAEYPAPNRLFLRLWRFLGISPSFSFPHTKLPMCYSSMGMKMFGKGIWSRTKEFERMFARQHPGRVGFGLGTIATGVLGNEPILSPEGLAEDIRWAKDSAAAEIFIFRLGGLDASYVSSIKEAAGV